LIRFGESGKGYADEYKGPVGQYELNIQTKAFSDKIDNQKDANTQDL
jgi:hypothetical protein